MGLAYAFFWAVAASTAVQLSPPSQHARAMSILVSGLTIPMVLGGLLGTFISEATGWRGGFWAVVVLTVKAASAGLWVLPKKTSGNVQEPNIMTELRAMKRPALWLVFATTAVSTTA